MNSLQVFRRTLVYIEVPVFADSNTYRRLVTLQASPTAAGGIMRLWQPLPLLPHVQSPLYRGAGTLRFGLPADWVAYCHYLCGAPGHADSCTVCCSR